ncbi:MAG: hypothetical protein HZC37_03640 [Burkholderiales bacterium]|nr:hypothetical protein [Burkholderiales bacterium]
MHALAVAAGLALLLGAGVYLLDRPAGSAWLIPAAWQAGAPGAWFGAIGAWLPSFVHTFAFSVLVAWLLPRRLAFIAAACLSWALVDTLAEYGQHAAVSSSVASALEAWFSHSQVAMQVGRYFTQGSFALADVAAGLAGSAAAFVALCLACPEIRRPRAVQTSAGPSRSSRLLGGQPGSTANAVNTPCSFLHPERSSKTRGIAT